MATKAHEIYLTQKNAIKGSITARIIGNIYRIKKNKALAIEYYRQSVLFAKEINNNLYQIKAQTSLAGELIGNENTVV